ncbi:uncharacterized protein DNG_06845 [Cephalotrichum gorgonifer]|uniref:MYND-type domain-containing protein n=1 Tax=Cephalotrichum gorgonifer TaxID=2041049 RepID=A0AAE8N188_9PEZI|nr:uncharacterized protein DNG_06845 [Cephalotrichum gorgonifer]
MSSLAPHLKPPGCEICNRKDALYHCPRCLAVYYCGQEHEEADQNKHTNGCAEVSRTRRNLATEYEEIRALPRDFALPDEDDEPDAYGRLLEASFRTGVGVTWAYRQIRWYLDARLNMVDTLLLNFGYADGRLEVVESALGHLLAVLRMRRRGLVDTAELTLSLYVSLDRNQEAYDFLKYYARWEDVATPSRNRRLIAYADHCRGRGLPLPPFGSSPPADFVGPDDGAYEWNHSDKDLHYLQPKNADMLEELYDLDANWDNPGRLNLSYLASLILIKVRALLGLQAIQRAKRALAGTLSPELMAMIYAQLAGSVIVKYPSKMVATTEETSIDIAMVMLQVRDLYVAIEAKNPEFWESMLNSPTCVATKRYCYHAEALKLDACNAIQRNHIAWYATPGAIDSIKRLRRVSQCAPRR